MNNDEAAKTAYYWYRQDCLEKIEDFDVSKLEEIAKEMSVLSLKEPIHLVHTKKFVVKSYFTEKRFTGIELAAWLFTIVDKLAYKLTGHGLPEDSMRQPSPDLDEIERQNKGGSK